MFKKYQLFRIFLFCFSFLSLLFPKKSTQKQLYARNVYFVHILFII